MSHQQTPAVSQSQSKAPAVPTAPSLPLPIDPRLLQHIAGGNSTSSPVVGW